MLLTVQARPPASHRALCRKAFYFGPTIDWNRLLAFLPTFERPDYEFAREEDSYYDWSPEVEEFHQALYETGALLVFHWSAWHDEAERLFHEPSALARADEVTLRKLLTFHARKERFAEGHLIEMFNSGHMNAILHRVRELHPQYKLWPSAR